MSYEVYRIPSALLLGLLLVTLSLLTTCGRNQDPDRLTLGGPFEFTTQDPSRDGYVYTRLQVAETLLEIDHAGNLIPGLATQWSVSDDGLRWQFTLRDGVRFHDGAQMDADAVVHALHMALRKPGAVRQAPINGLYVNSTRQITVQLSEAFTPLGAIMAHFTTAILSPASYGADAYVTHMFGTGPYQITGFDPPHRIDVVRFEHYWGTPANIRYANYLTGHRAESRALQVMAGQTDIIYTLDPASLDLLTRRSDVRVYSDTIPRTIQLKLNASHPFMNTRETRQAISLALDRTGIAEHIIRVPGSEANQLLPPSLGIWHDLSLPALSRNPDEARRLLIAQGWQPASDGIMRRGADRFVVNLVTYADRPELMVVATAIQAQLREVGIDVTVGVVNSSVIPSSHIDGTLEMALVARNYGNIADPLGVMLSDYGNNGNGEWGAMGWYQPELTRLLNQLKGETDTQRYRYTAQRISRILVDEMPVIPVMFYTQQTAVSARVQNFSFDPYERNYRISDMSFSAP
jgi:peptide/nickel transport system substrate-binding protein